MSAQDELDLGILVETFPECFSPAGHLRRPLKVGILHELLAHPNLGLSPVRLRRVIGRYANSGGYLANMVEGAARVRLDGQAAGVVTSDEAEHARRKLGRKAARRETEAVNASNQSAPRPSLKTDQPSRILNDVARSAPIGRVGLAGLKAAALARKSV
jgi:ProP effector